MRVAVCAEMLTNPNPSPTPAAETKKTGMTIVAAVGAAGAAVLGRFMGAMFGLKFVLPLVVGLVVAGRLRARPDPKTRLFAPAIGIQAAHVTWSLLGLLITAAGSGRYAVSAIFALLILASIGASVWLAIQPGPGPAFTLVGLNAYALVNVLRSIAGAMRPGLYLANGHLLQSVVAGGLAVAAIALLLIELKAFQASADAPAR